MLSRMAFYLLGKVVALNLDNSTAKACFCIQCGTVSLFLSRLACQILNLTDKHGITLIQAYICTILIWNHYLSWGWLVPEWHLLHIVQAAFQLWGQLEVDLLPSSHANQCQHYYIWENLLPRGSLVLNTSNHPWSYQVSFVFPTVALISNSVHISAEHITGQSRLLMYSCTFWIEAVLLWTVINMFEDVLHWCPIVKDLIRDVQYTGYLRIYHHCI